MAVATIGAWGNSPPPIDVAPFQTFEKLSQLQYSISMMI